MTTPFSFDCPYPSQRMPVLARNVVATSQPLATEAGLATLRQGGNAVDAALAAAMTLTVVEPTSNGIGSDAFAIVWDGSRLRGFNASGRSPQGWTPEYFDHKYPNLKSMPERGWDAVTVPGCVSLWQSLSRQLGKLPFAKLFDAAIGYADRGHLVSPITALSWSRQVAMLQGADYAEFLRIFAPGGRAPAAGELWRSPDHAATLADIAQSEGESFYRGALAERIAAASAAAGAAMTADDLSRNACDAVDTIHIDYRGVRLHEIPPNGQGLAALICLGILENFDVANIRVDSADWVHVHLEAMKLAFADAYRHVADPAHMDIDVEALLDKTYLKSRAANIRMNCAGAPVYGMPTRGGTVYLTAADASGMMVSLIQSNYMGFGAGIVVPGTGIALQNRGHGFNRIAGHPNRVAPNKRPFQTIIPGFLTDHANRPLMSFGVMGGHMQPQGHVQMVTRMIDHGQNPQAASDAARWIVNADGTIGLEPALQASVGAELARRGHRIAVPEAINFAFGGAQLIWRMDNGGYCAGTDSRKDGMAAGF
ncbi:MAG: gamma-glutamyltransferase family protein [Betaproteobacteria bacterium]|nr:gamma-glutamyltransferase family protein [Betaproteobacteria bacterium]